MKKPGFIITETIFSIILAASVAAVAVLAVDLKTNQFGLDKYNPFVQSFSSQKSGSNKETEKKAPEKATAETDVSENVSEVQSEAATESSEDKVVSQADVSEAESSKREASEKVQENSSAVETIKLVSEPKNLKAQPKELVDRMNYYGYSLDNIISGNRIIMIDTNGVKEKSKAKVYCYQKSESSKYWWNVAGDGKALTEEAYTGENGIDYNVEAGSKKTPGGIMLLGDGFYINDKPKTEYPLFKITEDTYWVTDPKSKFYNQHVEGTSKKDWSSAEHMITAENSYKYGLVINFNTDNVDAKKASAIFMHCGNGPTEGCIAVPEDVMKTILEWLDKDSGAAIFITV